MLVNDIVEKRPKLGATEIRRRIRYGLHHAFKVQIACDRLCDAIERLQALGLLQKGALGSFLRRYVEDADNRALKALAMECHRKGDVEGPPLQGPNNGLVLEAASPFPKRHDFLNKNRRHLRKDGIGQRTE